MKHLKKMTFSVILIAFVFYGARQNSAADFYPNLKAEYLAYIEQAAAYHLQESQRIIDKWKQNIKKSNLFGYSPTSYPASVGVVLGFMYEQTGDEKYVEQIVKLLLQFEDFKKLFPKEYYADRIEYKKGLPPISDFFSMNDYAEAYKYIRKSKQIDPKARAIIEQGVADCANYLLNYPEWGPMNRSILRAEVCLYSAQVLPQHPDAPKWRQMAEVLSSDSYQRWEEEDASHYHPVWLLSLFRFIEAADDADFFNSSIPHYYLDYFAHQITPLGLMPDYGDGRWPNWSSRWLAIFEKGAGTYRNPVYKWAAWQYWHYFKKNPYKFPRIGVALDCISAFRWCDDNIPVKPPAGKSRLVMEDVVGKKVVFQNGLDSSSTYLMLTYRDEGEAAFMPREYLRTTITAEEEKVHHGHSDENSIVMLVNKGSILLHDAGYREALPSGDFGAYRADYFHNRIVARKNKRWIKLEGEREEQSLLEFIRNSGAYRPVTTKLIDFFNFDKVDVSRTRLTDQEMGYQWDRTIMYHKTDDFFVVIDGLKALRRDLFTFTNLWHTQKIISRGERWFNTRIDSIWKYPVKGNQELLIYFSLSEHERTIGSFDLRRHRQSEKSIFETISSYYYENQMEVFVTILYPHKPGADLAKLLRKFEIIKPDKFPQAVGLKMKSKDREEILGIKLDLTMDYSQQNIRPRYEFNLGKVQYGPVLTDGNFTFISQTGKKAHWVCTHMTRLQYNEQVLHQSLRASFGLQPTNDPEVAWGYPKWRYWQGEVEVR